VVALAPAGGWVPDDAKARDRIDYFRSMLELVREAAPHADAIAGTPEGRRRATAYTTTNFEHIPAELIAHQIRGAAGCEAAPAMLEFDERQGWSLEAEKITCPVRIVWGTADRILVWPMAAVRYRDEWLPEADWVQLENVGHCPQLDVPVETGQLILGFTAS
jgi:pimeloyl-ACP methyl ester carboxylesterase